MKAMPCLIPIEDPDDPRIAPYRHIRERDLVGREGHFIAEGEVVLRLLLQSGRHRARSLLLAEKRVEVLAPLLEHVPADVPVYTAAQPVLDAIAGFPLHRGILALGQSAPALPPEDILAQLPEKALVVVLVGIANHDNMGGIFRNAAAFGADALILDHGCCDPLYRKAIRVSVGAALTVPFARALPETDLPQLLQDQGFEVLALSPAGKTPLSALRPAARVAALFGTEGPGLPARLLAKAHTVRIPMAGSFDSLNVATTTGIVLHHLACERSFKP